METLTVAIHQPRAGSDPGRRPEDTASALSAAAARGAHLVVFPELWLSGYGAGPAMGALAEPVDGEFASTLARLAKDYGIGVCYGYPERDGEAVFNAAAVIGPDGVRLANHRKSVLPSAYEKGLFSTGDRATVFDFGSWRVGLVICYEVEFPEPARNAALAGAELILAPTALGAAWPVVAEKVIPARAFENGVFVAYADWAGAEPGQAYYGGSRIVGPDGHVRSAALRGADLITARIARRDIVAARQRLPYLADLSGLPR